MATAVFDLSTLKDFTKKITSKRTLRKIMFETKTLMETATKKKIASGDVRGDKTLSPLTSSLRRKGSSTPLSDTGRLRRSIKGVVVNPLKIAIGSALEYSAIHQTGGTITRDSGDGKLYIPASPLTKKLSEQKGVRGTMDQLKKEGWNIFHTERAVLGISKGNRKRIKGSKDQRKKLSKKYQQLLFIKKESVRIPKREYLYVSQKEQRQILAITKNVLKGAA